MRIIALKARQVWVSTYIAERFWRDTAHNPGQHTYLFAQDLKTAQNIFKYYLNFHETYKPFRGVIARPARKGDGGDKLEYENGSYIKWHTTRTTGIARSHSLRRIHFSEFAHYGDNAREFYVAATSSLASDDGTEVFVESSANGVGNEYHLMWLRAVAGESEWAAFFFGWWEHPEYVRALSVSPTAFQATLTAAEREMRGQYNLTLEQLNWRRWKIANELNGDDELFKQEYPGNPEEAFLASGRPRFDHAAISRQPVLRDAMTGALEMLELPGGEKRLVFNQRERGDLVIFRQPQKGREYVIGSDVCEGIDRNEGKGKAESDFSVCQVHDRDTGEQAARFRARVEPAEFGYVNFLLAIYYYWAQIVPEANGPGLAMLVSLLNHGYPRNLIYHRPSIIDQDPLERSDLMGFKTTLVTRPQLVSLIDEALRTMALIIHDPVTIAELRAFVIKPSGKAEAQYGLHDDCVIAEGLALIGIQQMPRKKRQEFLPNEQVEITVRGKKPADDREILRQARLRQIVR